MVFPEPEDAQKSMSVPNVPCNFVPVKGGDTFSLGLITIRVG
jgi:hypothetical protein